MGEARQRGCSGAPAEETEAATDLADNAGEEGNESGLSERLTAHRSSPSEGDFSVDAADLRSSRPKVLGTAVRTREGAVAWPAAEGAAKASQGELEDAAMGEEQPSLAWRRRGSLAWFSWSCAEGRKGLRAAARHIWLEELRLGWCC